MWKRTRIRLTAKCSSRTFRDEIFDDHAVDGVDQRRILERGET